MNLGKLFGIPIRLHVSFLLLMGFFAVSALVGGGMSELWSTFWLEVALFGSVLLHELGHALAGRRYGIQTRDITLYPFGGIAAMESMPQKPMQELVVAIAGPAVNVALFTLAVVAWAVTGSGLFVGFAAINLLMGVFNMVPAYPMDGGRVLRALLATQMGMGKASDIAIRIGNGFAWLFVGAGLFTGWWSLALVGGFLMFALRRERSMLNWARMAEERARKARSIDRFEWPHPI